MYCKLTGWKKQKIMHKVSHDPVFRQPTADTCTDCTCSADDIEDACVQSTSTMYLNACYAGCGVFAGNEVRLLA